ncbi:hypothetical protein F971_03304 [Acinetobacter vivianii]|uniref:Uncharacterized protein n=1 Tax=Acinetobacter vivianii TaxID=1776742 RepID=N8UUA1_9GAMM|nr:hypothetical protein [Acinetobacter vivianii]ENU91166.1 hypothetical protein F971_03304 [Acinetobacter vivianii]
MKPIRNVKRWKKKIFWYGGLDNFLSNNNLESGIHTSQLGGLFYDVMFENNNADTTIFCFNAAMGKELKDFPVFTGNSMLAGEKVNRVFINDPSLYIDSKLKIAWYAGILNGFNVQDYLLKIIKHIIFITNTKRTIFYGASAGGFAALYYSWFFKNSLALVINPQTNLYRYNRLAVSSFAKLALGAGNDSEVEKSLSLICSRLDVLYSLGSSNHVFYVQNKTDHHVNDHLNPFLENLKNREQVRVIYGNWGQGHKAPPSDFSRILLKHIFKAQSWSEVINSELPSEVNVFDLDYIS